MSKTYLSADWHLSHYNSIEYCNRPFKSGEEMDNAIINNANKRFKVGDTLIHVGDFCFTSKTVKTKASEHEARINAKLIHVVGNHDLNNSVKSAIHSLNIVVGKKRALVIHRPPTNADDIPASIKMVLCGHVHTAWKHTFIEKDGILIPIINVGCDVWNYMPVDLGQIHGYYEQLMRANHTSV